MKWMKKEVRQVDTHPSMSEASRRIEKIFGTELMKRMPKNIQTSWIESECNYLYHTQANMTDGTPISIMYQKIFESYIEDKIVRDWRSQHISHHYPQPRSGTAKTLSHVLQKKYQLSYGKILSCLQSAWDEEIIQDFASYIQRHPVYPILIKYLSELKEILKNKAFTSKRHSGIVKTEQIAQIRDYFIWSNEGKDGLFIELYTHDYKLFEAR